MQIILGVALVTGPGLTLIVFKWGKKGLTLDLVLIGLFQLACLAAGVAVVYNERPIFFVYYEDHFYSVSADTFGSYDVRTPDIQQFGPQSDPPYNQPRGPIRVYVKLPESPIELADFRRVLYQDSVPAWLYEPLYAPLDQHLEEVMTHSIDIEEIRRRDDKGRLDAWLASHESEEADLAFFPIHSRYRSAFLGIRKVTGEFVDIVEIPPPR